MKTSAWILAAGLSFGVAGVVAPSLAAATFAAPAADDKADLTPHYTKGQTITFKQHTVRKDTMALAGVPTPEKPADGGKDAPKSDAKPDAKPDAKTETPKNAAVSAEQPKSEPKSPAAAPAAGGGPMSSVTTADVTATYELRITDVTPEATSMELELKSVVGSAELPSGKFTWDSGPTPDDKDASNPLLVSFRPIVGAVTKLTLGADGNVTKVEADSRLNTSMGGPLAQVVQQLVGPDGVRLRFGPVLWIKDGREPAVVGKSWKNTDEMTFRAIGKFVYETTNTLKSAKDSTADIDIAGSVALTGAEQGSQPAGTLKDQSASGSCLWDTKAGLVKKHVWQQRTVLDMKVGGAIEVLRTSELTVTTTRE